MIVRVALIAAVSLATLAPVQAQGDAAKDAAYARKVMGDYAKCVARSDADMARRFVLSPGDPVDDEIVRKVIDYRCLKRGGKLKMRPSTYRAALAEELIARDLKHAGPIDPSGVAPLAWAEAEAAPADAGAEAQADYERTLGEHYMARLGECVVRRDPAATRALLATSTGTGEELTALKALGTALPHCVRGGEKVSINRVNLRDAVAVSYYRLALAERSAG